MEQMSASIAQNTENARVTDGMASKAANEAVSYTHLTLPTIYSV